MKAGLSRVSFLRNLLELPISPEGLGRCLSTPLLDRCNSSMLSDLAVGLPRGPPPQAEKSGNKTHKFLIGEWIHEYWDI